MRATLFLLLLGATASIARAQAPGTGHRVTGVVFDSIAGHPLRGAVVQLARADSGARRYSAVSDSTGSFLLEDVTPGHYFIAFFHEAADSLGLEPSPIALDVGARDTSITLAIPSPSTFTYLACGDAASDSTGLLIGHLRDNDSDQPLADGSVTVAWNEMELSPNRWQTTGHTRTARTSDQGWFALCGVPSDVALLVTAHDGADSSGALQMVVPDEGVRHASIYVARRTKADAARTRIAGRVQSELGIPVQDARVAIVNSDVETTSSHAGEFTLSTDARGTQTIEVRAIGYLPAAIIVRVRDQESDRLNVVMTRRPVMIAGVKVTEKELINPRLKSFYDRLEDHEKGLGFGTYFTEQDVEKRHLIFTTSLFEQVSGIRVAHGMNPMDDRILGPRDCLMTVYLDGARVDQTDPVNELIPPNIVSAIEVYPRAIDAPGQYQLLNGSCGLVLFWTK